MENKYLSKNKQMAKKEFGYQVETFARGADEGWTFYISKDIPDGGQKKECTGFKTVDEALEWIDKQPKPHHFYEKLTENERVEYYDIDGPKILEQHDKHPTYWHNDKATIIRDVLEARKNWIATTGYNNSEIDPEKDVFLLESRKLNEKKSFHIIIRNGFVFRNTKEQKVFVNKFANYVKSLWSEEYGLEIDVNPYGSNQCFRMLGSTKVGDDRPFIRCDYNQNSLTCDRKLFLPSYIHPELKVASEKSYVSIENMVGIDYNKGWLKFVEDTDKVEEVKPTLQLYDDTISDEEALNLFKHLSIERWTDYKTCLGMIFLGKKMGLSDKDIHDFCSKAKNYDQQWVQKLIDGRRDDCSYSTATLRYFLYQDVDRETFKELFPRDKTMQEIMNIDPKKRTKKEQKFVDDILYKMTQKNIKELTHTEGFIARDKDKFVQVRDLNKGEIVVIKAGLGKGKTTATVNHINSNDYECIVVLTPRRSYAQTTISRVNKEISLPDGERFVLYSDLKGSIKHKYLVIQVESLHRFIHEFQGSNTLVVLDEVESLLYQMTSHKTHKGNHIENLDMFELLLTQSKKVLCMDAFISNKTLNVFKNIKKEFSYYNYTKDLEKRVAIEYPKKNKQGKKVYFFCSSRKQLTDYFLSEIKGKLPHKKIIEYHSKKSSIDLNSINEEWSKADLIIVTCTVTVGCNFDVPDMFNSIFVYASGCSRNLVRDIFQSCYRVRHLIDKKMYFCLDTRHNGINVPTNMAEITETISNKVKFHKSHYKKFLKMEFNNETPKWVKDLLINNIFESNMSIMSLKELFYKYLQLCNYDIEDEDEQELDDLDIEDEECNLVFEDYQYQDIPEITFTQRQNLIIKKKKEPLSDLEEFMLNKSYFQATLIVNGRSSLRMEDQTSLWNVYCNYGKKKFRNLQYEKGLNAGTLRICDIISSSFPEIADNLSRKLEDIIEITQKLGLKNSQDFKIIERKNLVDSLEWLEQNSTRFHTNFGLRNRAKGEFTLEAGSKLLGKIFNSWGYSKIKKGKYKKQRVNGKQIDISDYCCENTEDIEVYEYLEPKSKRKTDRKVRILKEGEDPLE
jgi:hypothetical protein